MAFDKDIPTAGTSLRASNPQILENQESLQEAMSNEHTFEGTAAGTQTGDHTQGSARCFIQNDPPQVRIDGAGFISTDLGSLWVDTNSSPVNQFNILTAITPTWTPISDEVIATLLAANRIFTGTLGVTGDFEVNTNKFTVDAATGTTATAGNAIVTGNLDVLTNIDPTSYVTDNGGFKNEATFSSNSATAVASQRSIKTFVDKSRIKGRVKFDGTTGIIEDSLNVTSVTKNGTGDFTITWDVDFSNSDYSVVSTAESIAARIINNGTQTAGTVQVLIFDISNNPVSSSSVHVIASGD